MIVTDISPEYSVRGIAIKDFKKFISAELSIELYESIASKVGLSSTKPVGINSWYPVSHFIKMQEFCAKEIGMDFRELVHYSTEFTLKEDLRGTYRFLMRLAGVQRLINKLPVIGGIYSNFVSVKVLQNQKKFTYVYAELPTILAEWYTVASIGAMEGILHVCNEKLVSFKVAKKESYLNENQPWSRWYYDIRY